MLLLSRTTCLCFHCGESACSCGFPNKVHSLIVMITHTCSVRSLESSGDACTHREASPPSVHNMHMFDRAPSAYRSALAAAPPSPPPRPPPPLSIISSDSTKDRHATHPPDGQVRVPRFSFFFLKSELLSSSQRPLSVWSVTRTS